MSLETSLEFNNKTIHSPMQVLSRFFPQTQRNRLCCVVQFRDRAGPFRVFLNQHDEFQAYLTP